MYLSFKANKIEPSVTLSITAKAKALKMQGVDVVSFGVGEPDFNTPANIIEAAISAMKNGNTKYTETNGIVPLRKAICDKLKNDNELEYKPEQIVVSNGAKQCLANVFFAVLNPGDEVIVPSPYWVSYPELISLADGVPVYVKGDELNGYKYTAQALKDSITDKTKAILLNSPNNPTGAVYTRKELTEIAEVAKDYNLLIISDEIYEKLIYDEMKHVSIASISEDAYKRTIVINGLSKSYSMTGWRMGYTASSGEIARLISGIQSHMTSNICSITQFASIEALTGPQEEIDKMIKEFGRRRKYMIKELEAINSISIIRPQGAFYIMVNIKEIIGKAINGQKILSSMEFAAKLLEEESVAVVPGEAFGIDNYIRISYATSIETIEKGINRIKSFIEKLV